MISDIQSFFFLIIFSDSAMKPNGSLHNLIKNIVIHWSLLISELFWTNSV